MKVVLAIHHPFELWNAPEWLGSRLQQAFPRHTFVQLANFERLNEEISEAEVFIGWQLRPEQFRRAIHLRWIHATTAAVHQLMFPELVASKVHVTNSTDIHGPVVAEHAITFTLALCKGLPLAAKYQAERHWGQQDLWQSALRPREISGATLGIIGLGAIGKQCVPLAKGLGMRVLAVRDRPELGSEGADQVYGTEQLKQMLAEADYVLLAAPLTAKTQAVFNDETFSAMRRDACFLNVSRGALVDESALERALRSKTIRAAALDVFATEPLPPDSPLWGLENLLITPHTAALTERLWERHYARIVDNIERFVEDRSLLGEVDKRKGY